MHPKLSGNRFLLTNILLALLVFILLVVFSFKQTQQSKGRDVSITLSHEVLLQTTKVLSTITDNETGSRGFILTGNGEFLGPLERSNKIIHQQLNYLKELEKGNASHQALVDSLLLNVERRIAFSETTILVRKEKGLQAAIDMVSTGRGKSYSDNIRRIVDQIQVEENRLLEQKTEERAKQIKFWQTSFLTMAFIMLGLTILLYWMERKRIELKVRLSGEEELAILSLQINQVNDAIITTDANRRIQSWNNGAQKLYGFTKEEALGWDINKLLQTVITNKEIETAIQKITEQNYWVGELERKSKSGTPVFVRSSSTTIRDSVGNITGYILVSLDITAQKKLREQVNHLANIVEQSSEAIFSRDLNQHLISWNKGAEELFGYSKAEAIGKKPAELGFIKLTSEEISTIEKQVIENGSWTSEMNYYRKDGTIFFGTVTANLIKNANGEPNSFYFIVKDISDRKKLEEQLKEFKYFFENSNDFSCIANTKGYFEIVNPSFEKVLGYSKSELSENPFLDFVHPDDIASTLAAYEELKSGATVLQFINRYKKKDGGYLWFDWNATPNSVTGKLYCIARDITEWKNAEDSLNKLNAALEQKVTARTKEIYNSEIRFRALIENITDAIVLNDENSNIIYQSPSVNKILGYTPEERKNKKIINYIHPDNKQDFKDLYNKLKSCPNLPFPFQYRFLHKNQQYIWLEGVVTNLLHNPAVKAYVANYRDITERKEVEHRMKNLNAELEERVIERTGQLKRSNEELEAFSYSVSHDLRAPLRAVIGYTKMLEEDYSSRLDAEANRITGIIKNSTLKMGNLIDDLLTFFRTGRNEIVKSTIDNNEMVEEIIKGMDEKITANVEWCVHPLPAVRADMNMMRQVWINLISNAVKYSGKSNMPKIEIDSQQLDGQTVFLVKDNGIGFDEKYMGKLFRVFQRLHSSEAYEGTGVGLAIVEKIITKHNGKIWVQAAVNKGATFFFSIPDN